MLVELEMTLLRGETHLSDALAEVVQIIDAHGLPYVVTPTGTCMEGDWDKVMPVVRECHERMCTLAPHVFTRIRIEDEAGATDQLRQNVAHVIEKAEENGQAVRPALTLS